MEPPGGREGFRRQVVRGVGLLVIVIGMLMVGTLGPDAFSLDALVGAIGALGDVSRSASPAPLLAGGLLVGGLLLAVHAEFGPFGRIEANADRATAPCRVCEHTIDTSRETCPYCDTAEPVERR